MDSNPLSLREMLTHLEQRLERLSLPEMQRALLDHAANLPADERRTFLDIFPAPGRISEVHHTEASVSPAHRNLTWPVDSDPLLADIDDLAERIESGYFFEGFGWDDEIHDQRSFGNESWADEMDDYFHAARQAFSNGEIGLARTAYRKLFDALDLDDEVGTFAGQGPAVVMLDANLHEAMSQYLRAVYETSAPVERADELSRQWTRLPLPGEEPSLQDIRDCAPEDVPNLEGFLPLWVGALSDADRSKKLVRTLLVEAAIMSGGPDALGNLARQPGPGRGSLYLEWVKALRSVGDTDRAVDAAREALTTEAFGSRNRAAVAEELAELSAPDNAAVLEARRIAWRSEPSETRLLALHHAAAQQGSPMHVMAEELAHADADQQTKPLGRTLFSALLLLAGGEERATRLLSLPPTQREREVSSAVLVPYLLVSASKALGGEQHAIDWANGYLEKVDRSTMMFRQYGEPAQEGAPTLSELFASRIRAEVPEPAALESRLEAALGQLGRDVDAIVSDKRRGEYQKAAEWLADGALALSLARGDTAGLSWYRDWFTRYPRHVAFRRELERAWPEASSTT
ncbi:hypothetical protein GCM10009715_33880 [Paeniglutamicibacter psychrophenolicus]|uniref:DUF4034 domain-containing protein n=1 Tax=Paeniglutamicibacter psychrophenolicus TaxID=257454 RepID=A0ABS4W9V4_9MICC|nr:hypothetical protein [Paeniglutamicibacter psychrophenolicus]MBP2372977.1 hypothetical protein [Paeniglutamicibacter psychrophenolicus]